MWPCPGISTPGHGHLQIHRDSPGANDNAFRDGGVWRPARVLTMQEFGSFHRVHGALGESRGLWGEPRRPAPPGHEGVGLRGWVLNNDMIEHLRCEQVSFDNTTLPDLLGIGPRTDSLSDYRSRGGFGRGVVGRPLTALAVGSPGSPRRHAQPDPILIYRLDVSGRGGHHAPPFNDISGSPASGSWGKRETYDRRPGSSARRGGSGTALCGGVRLRLCPRVGRR